jgi:MSHA biogenesis protein MshP
MFPKRQIPSPQQQRGAALAVAVFIIVVMGLIGMAMVRILGDASSATVSEVLGARAQAAARSGAETLLVELYPLGSADADINVCPSRTGNLPTSVVVQTSYAIDGLANCSTTVLCDQAELTTPYTGVHFRILAQGSCNAGDMTYSKEIMLEASDGVY